MPGATITDDRPRAGAFAGLGVVVRFMLRRDRVRLVSWAGGIGLFGVYVSAAVTTVYADDLSAVVGLFADPVGRLMTGPGYGFDEPTIDRVIAGGYSLYFMIASALMSILLVTRHTRGEEQAGRAELVRAGPLGRHATLLATLVVALITNIAAAGALLLALLAVGGLEVHGSLLIAASTAAVGMAFTGITTITVQLTEYSRAAAGLAGGVLAAAYILRAGGDMASTGGSLLSWLSPLGWAQQTAPFVLDRWWPLALLLVLAAVTIAAGFALSSRRDLGASFLAVRPGPPRAHPSLGRPWGLALRMQRASIIGWTAALAAAGFVFGTFADAILDVDEVPEVFLDLFGAEDLLAGYLGVMTVFMAIFVAVYCVLAVQGLRFEETKGRVEPVLATPLSRTAWFGTNLAAIVLGAVVMSIGIGLANGLGAAVVTGEAHHMWDLTVAQLNTAPPVLVALGLATLLFGLAPRAVAAAWVVPFYGLLVNIFGELLDLPHAAVVLDPFGHVAQMPLEDFALQPVVALTAAAALSAVVGLRAFTRREITAK